jgi:hypothetical protein
MDEDDPKATAAQMLGQILSVPGYAAAQQSSDNIEAEIFERLVVQYPLLSQQELRDLIEDEVKKWNTNLKKQTRSEGITASTILLMIILEPLLGFFPVEPSLESEIMC